MHSPALVWDFSAEAGSCCLPLSPTGLEQIKESVNEWESNSQWVKLTVNSGQIMTSLSP